jgi:hypothetical protein
MAAPAPVLTITPGTATQTMANLAPSVQLADTGTHSPVADSRAFKMDGTTVKSTVGASGAGVSTAVPYPVNLAAGTHQGSVTTTSAGGSTTSANVPIVVTDSVAAANTLYQDSNGQSNRMHPDKLSYEYRDPTMATPGPQTASGIYNARNRGTIL